MNLIKKINKKVCNQYNVVDYKYIDTQLHNPQVLTFENCYESKQIVVCGAITLITPTKSAPKYCKTRNFGGSVY